MSYLLLALRFIARIFLNYPLYFSKSNVYSFCHTTNRRATNPNINLTAVTFLSQQHSLYT